MKGGSSFKRGLENTMKKIQVQIGDTGGRLQYLIKSMTAQSWVPFTILKTIF
jgi:hypothetical protein